MPLSAPIPRPFPLKVPGFVWKVAVKDNQIVKAGDLLASLDDRDYRAELAKAEASVEGEKAFLANLDAAAQLQAAIIDQARSKTESTAAKDGARPRTERARTIS